MKRVLILLMTALMIFSFAACATQNGETSSTPDSSENNSSAVSETASSQAEESSEESMEPIVRTWPYVTGTFLQPGAFANYSDVQWERHFNGLLEVGIDTLIIQWTSTTPYGKVADIYYPSEFGKENAANNYVEYTDFLDRCLKAAEKCGIKVFVGLNNSDEWWAITCTKKSWCETEANIGIISAKEIYGLYKEKYPNALAGWYFVWEMFNGMSGHETEAGEFLNMYLEPLTEIDPSMPLMLSPFVTAGGGTAQKAEQEWKKVFETANFREGDIFCCQDAVGAGWITIDQLDSYFAALKAAVDTEPGLHFWANNENFDQSDWSSANIGRFIKQMQISDKYVENHITFAYSHYYAKDYNNKAGYHYAYKYYYDTGVTQATIQKPEVTFVDKDDGRVAVTVETLQNGFGFRTISIYGDGTLLKTADIQIVKLKDEVFHMTYTLAAATVYKIELTDYYGNKNTFNYKH